MGDGRKEVIGAALEADPRAYAEKLGLRFSHELRSEPWYFCPWHEESTASFHLWKPSDGNWIYKCFSCGKSGDLIGLYAACYDLDCAMQFPQVLDGLETFLGLVKTPGGNGHKPPPKVLKYDPPPRVDDGRPRRGKRPADAKIAAVYDYTDEVGKVLYQAVRYEWTEADGTKDKDFSQRQPDPGHEGEWLYTLEGARRVPLSLPLLGKWRTIYLVEGEKKALLLQELGAPATCIAGGAKAWSPKTDPPTDYAQFFKHATRINILPDRDRAGEEFLQTAAKDLLALGLNVWRFDLTEYPMQEKGGDDIGDWILERRAEGKTDHEIGTLLVKRMTTEATRITAPPEPPPPLPAEPPPADAPVESGEVPNAPEATPGAVETKPEDPVALVLRKAAEIAANPKTDTVRKLARIGSLVTEVRGKLVGAKVKTADDWLDWPRTDRPSFSTTKEAQAVIRGSSSGMMALDFLTHGLRAGWWIIRGDSGKGKSTLVNQWVTSSSLAGTPWLVIPFEDSPIGWRVMMLARLARVNSIHISTNEYPADYVRELVEAQIQKVAEIESGITYPKDEVIGSLTVGRLREIAELWHERICRDEEGVGGIVIDPIQRVAKAREDESIFERMTEAAALAQEWVRRWKIPVITTVHLNRNREEKGSTEFEFSAHVRVSVEDAKKMNDGISEEEAAIEPYCDVNLLKNKGLPTGKLLCRYRKPWSLWEVLSDSKGKPKPAEPAPPPPPQEPPEQRELYG